MRDYGKVAGTFWTRGSGKELRGDRDSQVLALYLMTAPASSMIGLYHIALPTMAHETGLSIEGASKALQRLSELGIAYYDDGDELVWIPRMPFWQIAQSLSPIDKRVKGIKDAIQQFRGHRFYWDFVRLYNDCYHLELEAPPKGLERGLEAPPKPGSEAGSEAGSGSGTSALQPPATPPATAPAKEPRRGRPDKPAEKKCRLIDVSVDPEGLNLDGPDRMRRGFYVLWSEAHDGRPAPQEPEKDRKQGSMILERHRAMHVVVPWLKFGEMVCRVYLSMEDRFLVENGHPMALISTRWSAIVQALPREVFGDGSKQQQAAGT